MINLQRKLMLQLINYLSRKILKKAAKIPPYFFHGAFAPSFIWCRHPSAVQLVSKLTNISRPTRHRHST